MNAVLRGFSATLVGSLALFSASSAFAAGEPCFNDTDCPGGGAVCGGDVCNWGKTNPMGTADKPYTCNPAGTGTKGSEGWCTVANGDVNCKCAAQGAKCVGTFCTFTKASDAPAGTGGSGAGGSAAGGSTSTAGTTSTAGAAMAPAEKSGGCSVGVPGNASGGALVGACLVGLGIALSRRRR